MNARSRVEESRNRKATSRNREFVRATLIEFDFKDILSRDWNPGTVVCVEW